MKKELIGTFTAIDADGKTYSIDAHQNYIPESDMSGTKLIPNTKEYSFRGGSVSHVGGDRFKIIQLDTEVKKIV